MAQIFYKALFEKVMKSLPNDYKDNFDYVRFGAPKKPTSTAGKIYTSTFFEKRFFIKSTQLSEFTTASNIISDPLFDKLSSLYNNLEDDQSQSLLIDIIAYRLLGHKKVKLPLSNKSYWDKLSEALKHKSKPAITAKWNNEEENGLGNYNLQNLGFNITLDAFKGMILVDFILEQYKYSSISRTIQVNKGDTVLDCGGFWGDTALYFAHMTGPSGKVYTFEFIPENLKVLESNLNLNPHLRNSITVVRNPVWEFTDTDMYYISNGAASKVSFEPDGANAKQLKTISIDQLVKNEKIEKVDFIKMDIESAEPNALRGAENTLKKYRPTLAIAIYHSLSDFVSIPEYIHNLNLGYKFYLGHYTIFEEETILFATIH